MTTITMTECAKRDCPTELRAGIWVPTEPCFGCICDVDPASCSHEHWNCTRNLGVHCAHPPVNEPCSDCLCAEGPGFCTHDHEQCVRCLRATNEVLQGVIAELQSNEVNE